MATRFKNKLIQLFQVVQVDVNHQCHNQPYEPTDAYTDAFHQCRIKPIVLFDHTLGLWVQKGMPGMGIK